MKLNECYEVEKEQSKEILGKVQFFVESSNEVNELVDKVFAEFKNDKELRLAMCYALNFGTAKTLSIMDVLAGKKEGRRASKRR